MRTLTHTCDFTVPALPERVFPLLCPVREYDWIPTWQGELLHSVSGVAEEDCVFRTTLPHGTGSMTWVVSRYDPPTRIEFTCFVPDFHVFRLKIALTASAGATRLDWTHRWFAVGPSGEAWIAAHSEEAQQKIVDTLQRLLTHYLATGEMLRP
jgi:hypothetical protein